MIDARRMEVYTALYAQNGEQLTPIEASILDAGLFKNHLDTSKIVFFGNGAAKGKEIVVHENAVFVDSFHPSARFMPLVSHQLYDKGALEDVAYFEPFYLKDFMPTTPRKNFIEKLSQ
jgi:tRNA threonylcarbamoyladenosine biosynthesis protein TsaB